jgi:cytochrome c biogenesis protein CcmG/thiol:disulfide interchange protein DsbE
MSTQDFPDARRRTMLRAGLALGVAGAGALLWKARGHGYLVRLFNPFTAAKFELPALEGLKDEAGHPIPGFSSAEIAGKTAYVNIFASWCPYCREEHAALMQLAASGVKIYGVATLDNSDMALAFLLEMGNPYYRLGVDPKGYLMRALGASGVPAHFVFSPAPKLAFTYQGPLTLAQMREKIVPALA